MKQLITALLITLSAPALAEVDVALSRSGAQGSDIRDGYEIQGSVSRGSWNIWASYADHDQVIVTQSAGNLSIIGLGIGYESGISEGVAVYLDAGMATIDGSYSDRVVREAIYFSFQPTFEVAHWLPDGNYMNPDLTYEADFDQAALVRVGAQFQAMDRLSFDIAYRWLKASQFLMMQDTTDTSKGWWEGSFDRDLSAVSLGISWEF